MHTLYNTLRLAVFAGVALLVVIIGFVAVPVGLIGILLAAGVLVLWLLLKEEEGPHHLGPQ